MSQIVGMPKILVAGGAPYSDDFLINLEHDLHNLAVDYEKSNGNTAGAKQLLLASNVVKRIRAINSL